LSAVAASAPSPTDGSQPVVLIHAAALVASARLPGLIVPVRDDQQGPVMPRKPSRAFE
jgi:hypothetical protein